jgi:hypothetical protein
VQYKVVVMQGITLEENLAIVGESFQAGMLQYFRQIINEHKK